MFVEAYGKMKKTREVVALDVINDVNDDVCLIIRDNLTGNVLSEIARITNKGMKLQHINTWIHNNLKIPVDKNGKIKLLEE